MTRRTIDREAVAKALRELEILFGRKKSPPEKENAEREFGAGDTGKIMALPTQDTAKTGCAQ